MFLLMVVDALVAHERVASEAVAFVLCICVVSAQVAVVHGPNVVFKHELLVLSQLLLLIVRHYLMLLESAA